MRDRALRLSARHDNESIVDGEVVALVDGSRIGLRRCCVGIGGEPGSRYPILLARLDWQPLSSKPRCGLFMSRNLGCRGLCHVSTETLEAENEAP
jgi:hypothetical protein